MNPKETIKLLKQCKEAIKNKDYPIALKSCKEVLKIDRKNYMALVFLGAVLQETDKKDQAGNAFLKAIEVSPNEMLAWQGLSSFYEKGGVEENATQLIPVYKQLLRLESDSTKWCEIMSRVEPLLIKTGDAETLASIANDYMWVEDLKKIDTLQQVLLNCLSVITIPDHLSTLFGKVLSTAMKRVHFHDWTRYFDQLYRNKLHEIVFITAIELLQINQRAIFLHDWICRIFAETCILKKGYMQEFQHKIPDHVKILLDDYPQNVHAILAQSALYYLTGSYIEARDLLNQCLSINRTLFYGHFLLSEVQFELINYVEALKSAECALSLNTSESKMATKLLIKCLAFSMDKSNWMKAVELSKDFLSSDVDYPVTEYCARAYLKLDNWTEFEKSINQLKEDPSFDAITNLLEAKRKAKSESDDAVLLNQLITLAELYPNNAEIILEVALLYEKEEDYKNAYIYLIKTAKIAPHWYIVYLKLGNCYFRIIKDYDKASRCYQKALQLHPDSDEIGIAMSDTYKMLGDVANHIKLLEMICSSRNAKWAWLRLGLQHLQAGDSTAAVHSLRTALSFDPNQSHLWEALADAYLSRGNHRAALKSYEQAVELRPGAFYPKLQIATIKQVIDQTEESLMDFRELVTNGPSSVLALKGLAETCLCIAKSFWERRLFGLSFN
uniref:Tetratricopeptide repeat protein 37 n=1 Tax=Clastoptera arizonana TaxID=38151 RepID=A0A1B6DWI4_9HEMI